MRGRAFVGNAGQAEQPREAGLPKPARPRSRPLLERPRARPAPIGSWHLGGRGDDPAAQLGAAKPLGAACPGDFRLRVSQ